jgi:hypothetical protein
MDHSALSQAPEDELFPRQLRPRNLRVMLGSRSLRESPNFDGDPPKEPHQRDNRLTPQTGKACRCRKLRSFS